MTHVETDGAYEHLLREHQELEADNEKLTKRVKELEETGALLAMRLEKTEDAAHYAGALGAEACFSCQGTGAEHSEGCPVLMRRTANKEALGAWEKVRI